MKDATTLDQVGTFSYHLRKYFHSKIGLLDWSLWHSKTFDTTPKIQTANPKYKNVILLLVRLLSSDWWYGIFTGWTTHGKIRKLVKIFLFIHVSVSYCHITSILIDQVVGTFSYQLRKYFHSKIDFFDWSFDNVRWLIWLELCLSSLEKGWSWNVMNKIENLDHFLIPPWL